MKPQIFFSRGWWRITPVPASTWPEKKVDAYRLWNLAHQFVSRINNAPR